MNIKQAEALSGITRRNIRFYEQEGMISPSRNQENDYREYSDEDIQKLKLIRALRMVDMPLDDIRNILAGQTELSKAAAEQEARLKLKTQELETAIYFCREFRNLNGTAPGDIDKVLSKMEAPENKKKLFKQWVHDYRLFAKAQHEKVFTFLPDGAVTTPEEFTAALCQYADAHGLNLVITKESMYPEFTIDGIEYTAERFYTRACYVPVASIRCTAKHPETLEPDLPKSKKIILKMWHYSWIPALLIFFNIGAVIRGGGLALFSTLEGWVVFISIFCLTCTGILRYIIFHYNENGK